MTLTVWAIDEVAADAQIMRQAMGSLIGSAGGLEKTGALGLTQKGTPNMSVQVAVGGVWIPGTVTTSQGPYFAYNSAVYERSIEAAGASNPRVDTIVAQIKDATYEGSERLPVIEALKGKEESGVKLEGSKSAGLAAVPHSCIVLGYVLVPAKATTIVTADIENVTTVVVGGLTLANESVTDAKVVKGRALVETENAYSARVERLAGTEYEANATRSTLVVISENGSHPINEAFVGGISIATKVGESLSFIVPPKVKWKALTLEEHSYFSSTLIL